VKKEETNAQLFSSSNKTEEAELTYNARLQH